MAGDFKNEITVAGSVKKGKIKGGGRGEGEGRGKIQGMKHETFDVECVPQVAWTSRIVRSHRQLVGNSRYFKYQLYV